MLQRFEKPTINVSIFEITDIITTSSPGLEEEDDTIVMPDVPM